MGSLSCLTWTFSPETQGGTDGVPGNFFLLVGLLETSPCIFLLLDLVERKRE